jgi:hypothetical protein
MAGNVAKLRVRYPDKFTETRAAEGGRDRAAEMEAMAEEVTAALGGALAARGGGVVLAMDGVRPRGEPIATGGGATPAEVALAVERVADAVVAGDPRHRAGLFWQDIPSVGPAFDRPATNPCADAPPAEPGPAEGADPPRPDDSHAWQAHPNLLHRRCGLCGAYSHLGSGFRPCPARQDRAPWHPSHRWGQWQEKTDKGLVERVRCLECGTTRGSAASTGPCKWPPADPCHGGEHAWAPREEGGLACSRCGALDVTERKEEPCA